MGAYQLGLSFEDYAIQHVSSENPELPASNLGALRHPWRGWWANGDDTSPVIEIDRGASGALPWLFLDGANFSTAALATSSNGSSWSSYGSLSIPSITRLQSTDYPRRGGLQVLTGVTNRYLQLALSGLDAGATQYRLMTLGLVPSVRTLVRNFNTPVTWTQREKMTRLDYDNDGFELPSDGRPRLGATLVADPWPRQECLADFYAIEAVGKGRPMLVYENQGDPSAAYIVTRTNDLPQVAHFRILRFSLDVEQYG